MANLQWEFETTIGSVNYGAILMRIAPIQGEYGDIAFGVTAPDGTILKAINPLFATAPSLYRDVEFFEQLVPPYVVASIPFDSLGELMNGVYTLTCHYIFHDQSNAPTQSALRTVTFTLNRIKTATTKNNGSLITSSDWNAGTVTVIDNSVYTGLTTPLRSITLVGTTTTTTTGTQLTSPIASYVATLTANVFKQYNPLGDVAVLDYFTVYATITTSADYANYKTIADQAIAYLNKNCSFLPSLNTMCIMRNLEILALQKSLGYDMTLTLAKLKKLLA
jgi:hypothetical protein